MEQIHEKVFKFKGLQEFSAASDEMNKIYQAAFQGNDYSDFEMAVIEAMSNAAQYSLYGPTEARISMCIRIMPNDIGVTIFSKTQPFDVRKYRKKMQKLAAHPEFGQMDWGDYIGERNESSGFWYMLTGCDYLYMDENGQRITLVAKTANLPLVRKQITRINLLVPRFLIRTETGVIE